MTRSSVSSRVSASPRSSRRSPDPRSGCGCSTEPHSVLAEFQRDPAHSANGFPEANMFDQPDLEALLRANLKHYPCAELAATPRSPTSPRTGGTNPCDLDDRARAKHIVEANYVLGCDGANSVVRSCIGAGMHDLKFDQRWLVVDIATSADLDQWDGVHQVCDPIRAATYMRIGDSRYRWEFQLLPGETADDFGHLDALRPLIAPWVGHVPPADLTVVRVDGVHLSRATRRPLASGKRVFLLGDAAHLTPPFIGQGMGAGMRDAMNLAWKLAGVARRRPVGRVLDTYEQERKPHARIMIRMALGMGWAMTSGGDVGNLIRRVVVPRLHLVPGLRDKLIEKYTAPRRSALVAKTRAPWQLAGTLCPNPLVANRIRLDTVLGDGFSMVSTARPPAFQCALLDERGAVLHIAEPGSELACWLRRGRVTAAIIRPDRTVMCASRNLGALCAAMPAFHRAPLTTRKAPSK